jgi:hypothetical protein
MVLADARVGPAAQLMWVVLQRAGLAVHSVERVFLRGLVGYTEKIIDNATIEEYNPDSKHRIKKDSHVRRQHHTHHPNRLHRRCA